MTEKLSIYNDSLFVLSKRESGDKQLMISELLD